MADVREIPEQRFGRVKRTEEHDPRPIEPEELPRKPSPLTSLISGILRRRPRKPIQPESVDTPDLPPELDGRTPELLALEERLERQRTTSLLSDRGNHGKRRDRKSSAANLDCIDPKLMEADRQAALAHRTSLLTTKPRRDRSRSLREHTNSGLLLPLVLLAAVAGGAYYAADPARLPSEVQNIDWDALKLEAENAAEKAEDAVKDVLHEVERHAPRPD